MKAVGHGTWERRTGRKLRIPPRLAESAQREVQAVLLALPEDLRRRSEGIPVNFELYPSPSLRRSGIEADTMGLFTGADFLHESDGIGDTPPQIILFLGNILDEAGGDMDEFRAELRRTLLHELGHYLGLEEDELDARGLD